ncbi:MAG: peroxiredoxin [Deltaproteobacteria bacterium]|nr:peroxiredoxin [Deltaproteobacteria bacterium]MBI3294090.1 peroxiredoxin [Deltaproteobacteria bacterium]
MKYLTWVLAVLAFLSPNLSKASAKIGESAPVFVGKTESGESFSLESRKGKGWTVLFFYPKAGTPGCTAQACAFRDSVKAIRSRNAEVYGISADSVEAQKKFHDEHKLIFSLIADPDMHIIRKYDAAMEDQTRSRRWTFILDPTLTIRAFDDQVDPVMDAKKVAAKLTELQKKTP